MQKKLNSSIILQLLSLKVNNIGGCVYEYIEALSEDCKSQESLKSLEFTLLWIES